MTRIGVLRETLPGETRVALVPIEAAGLCKLGHEVVLEPSSGVASGFGDDDYVSRGASLAPRVEVLASDVVVAVRTPTSETDLASLRPGALLIGLSDPLGDPDTAHRVALTGVSSFALDLLPRITRAQAMDALSSQAALIGYKAVVVAAERSNKIFPMLSTAAGTLRPTKVLVVGVGVAGLSAVATARRLGAVVQAYDVRPEAREQVESVGGQFVELALDTSAAAGDGGYAASMDDDFYRRQRELLASTVAANDIVVTTALVPGRKAPLIVTAAMVHGMRPGSIVVDVAAAQGGNCELTRPDEQVDAGGVLIYGPTNLAASVPSHASQLYAKNVATFLRLVLGTSVQDGPPSPDLQDDILAATLVGRAGGIVNPAVLAATGGATGPLPPPASATARASTLVPAGS